MASKLTHNYTTAIVLSRGAKLRTHSYIERTNACLQGHFAEDIHDCVSKRTRTECEYCEEQCDEAISTLVLMSFWNGTKWSDRISEVVAHTTDCEILSLTLQDDTRLCYGKTMLSFWNEA